MASGTVANEGKWYSRVAQAISSVTSKISRSESVFPEEKSYGKYAPDMPSIRVAPLSRKLQSAATGPNAGLCQLDLRLETFPDDGKPVAGITNWQNGRSSAEGVSTSLYDRIPGKDQHSGDPVADVFAVVSYENSGVLAIADGVNWGRKPRLAARCAVNGAMSHILERLYTSNNYPITTQDIFHTILRSFEVAQHLIIESEATTTTLCVAVVCELMPTKGPTRWGCCLVCLGDSLGYVYRRATGVVEELTSFSHRDVERDMRNCGGCLGPHIGVEPDVENMFCVFAPVAEHDIVFLATDGISDNFDPVVRKEALPTPLPNSRGVVYYDSDSDTPMDKSPVPHEESLVLPFLSPTERHSHSLKLMTNVINRFSDNDSTLIDAMNVATHLMTNCYNITDEQRTYLEKNILPDDCTPEERRQNYRDIKRNLKKLPGKLDHATVVAYEVLQFGESCVPVQQPKKRKVVPKAKSFDSALRNDNDDDWTNLDYKTVDTTFTTDNFRLL